MNGITQTTSVPVQPKWVGKSMTIWGSLFALIAVAYGTVGPILDAVGVTIPVTPQEIEAVKNVGTDTIKLAGTIFGTALVWWGRIRAGRNAQPITFTPDATPVTVKVVPAGNDMKASNSPKRSG